ncbi:hypothetical protein N431DRAFT_446560 [Stipitochalara longipes BDJ]|nr:hypothetical protein N431DRAFT_446560 [Stipitochalara longipes BDJ]
MTVYQTYPDNVDPMTNFFCAVPTGAASSTSSSSISSPLSSPSPFTAPSSPSSTSSKAWIAGPVLGSLALIAVIGFGLWYIRNQRRHRKESSPAPQNPDQQFLPETKAELPNEDVKREGGVGGESAIPPTLATQPQAQNENLYYEMDPSQTQGVELPSNRPVEAGRAELSS